MSPLIMHIDMDAFFASVEQRVNPSLRGKPVIVGGRNNKYRAVVVAASYEAKALGIGSAMPSWEALRICPQAEFVPADTAKYIYTSDQIHTILKDFSPQIEKFSIDEFFLDIKNCERDFGSYRDMGQAIKDKIKERFGLTCSVGIAPTKISAKLAAKMKKPDGLVVLQKEEARAFLKDLPVEKICGIGRRLQRRFNHLGVETCGQLAGLPDKILKEYFGVVGLWLKAACLVEDTSPIGFYRQNTDPLKSVGHSQTLRETTSHQEFIKTWIYLLSEMVATRMRRLNVQGRTVYFYVCDGFEGGYAKQKTFQLPTYDGYEIYQRCLRIIELIGIPHLCARILGVSVSGLLPADCSCLFERQKKRERMLRHVDRINHKYGEWTVYPAMLIQAGRIKKQVY